MTVLHVAGHSFYRVSGMKYLIFLYGMSAGWRCTDRSVQVAERMHTYAGTGNTEASGAARRQEARSSGLARLTGGCPHLPAQGTGCRHTFALPTLPSVVQMNAIRLVCMAAALSLGKWPHDTQKFKSCEVGWVVQAVTLAQRG